MAACKLSASELIQDVFSPCVAVLCSSDVEAVCAKNNLTFVEMVQPFCRINTEITVRDPSGMPCIIRNLRLVMKDMNFQPPPLNIGKKMMHDAVACNFSVPDGVRSNVVSIDSYEVTHCASTPWFEAYRELFFQVLPSTDHEFMHHFLSCIFVVSSSHNDPLSQINELCQQQAQHQLQNSHNSSKWFFSYILKYYVLLHDTSVENLAKAETVYQSMKSSFGASVCHLLQINSSQSFDETWPKPHEEMNGTSNIPDPWSQFMPKYPQESVPSNNEVEETVSLTPSQNEDCCINITDDSPNLSERNCVISHPLLNNSEDLPVMNDNMSEAVNNDSTRTSHLNTWVWGKSNNRNKKHGLCLTLSDMDRIRVCVQDFCIQGLVPFVEKQIRILNDQVTNRKSIHRTIFGVTKKLFAGNKPGVHGPAASLNTVIYGQDAPELQVRKLGDLAFMFQLYEVAYQAYHTAKRDFSADQAWFYFAGASEMAALSVFMQGNNIMHEYPARYMETAITTYLHTCKFSELAIRATFLSTECLKAKTFYDKAALQFIRMPSDADLPCALFLEQAAHCYVNCKPPKIRKYAFHVVLAGHRFSKAGQRKHALRLYSLAEQVFKQIGWSFANNHVYTMIGRFSMYLNHLETACMAFSQLLCTQCQQPMGEQAAYLRDYLLSLKQYLSKQCTHETYQLPTFPVPIIDCQATKVLLSEENMWNKDGSLIVKGRGFSNGDLNNHIWAKLEELLIVDLHGSLPSLHSPQLCCLTQSTNNTSRPLAISNEVITVEVVLRNSLSIAYSIDNVFLLWTFTTQPDPGSGKDPVSFSNELEFSKTMLLNSVVQTEVVPRITLEPLQERKLHISLKPIHTGSLLIRGISYSLVSPIGPGDVRTPSNSPVKSSNNLSLQGKQLIQLTGPRLNKTTAEKTSQTYAFDYRLNLQVIESMPKLEVKYHSFPYSLFCGEVYQTVIEFSNVGQEPLDRLFVASSMPDVFALGHPHENNNLSSVYKEVPCNKNHVPQTLRWTGSYWRSEVLTHNNEQCHLNPGESLQVPFWLRGPDIAGDHNIQLLFFYESSSDNDSKVNNLKLSHRLLQHSIVLCTKSSMTFCASAMTSHTFDRNTTTLSRSLNTGSLVLSLEAANVSEEPCEVNIIQISCVSPKWSLSAIDENLPKSFPVIRRKESSLLSLKALYKNIEPTSSSHDMVLSCVPFGHFEIDSHSSPCLDFTQKATSTIRFRDGVTADRGDQDAAIRNKMESILLLLTVIWKAKVLRDNQNFITTGQHHISVEAVHPSTISASVTPLQSSESISECAADSYVPVGGRVIRCSLTYPFHVEHDFRRKRLVNVPVEFMCQNICSKSLCITVDNLNITNQPLLYGLEDNQTPVSQSFTWVRGSKKELQLRPSEITKVNLEASFCNPGTYNLGCLNITVSCNSAASVTYTMSPYLIVISACNLSIH